MLKYGDVIAFRYCSANVTAMVIAASTKATIISDEGTAMDKATTHRVLVYGLTRGPEATNGFHRPGITATFDTSTYPYEVIG